MTIEKIKLNEIRNIIQFGEATISGIHVLFSYNIKNYKFTNIAYDKYKASGIFDEGGRDTPQEYLVGRVILKALRTN